MKYVLALTLQLVLAGPTWAEDVYFLNGNILLELCAANVTTAPRTYGTCVGYVMGIFDSVTNQYAADSTRQCIEI